MDRMTTTIPQGLSETRAMALAMFEHQVPCFFQLGDPACEKTAGWLLFFGHEESPPRECDGLAPWPVCDEHRRKVQQMSSAFWRMWMGVPSVPCDGCGTPIRLDRVEAL